MDDCRFDNWTRLVDRRTAAKGMAGGAAAALLTLTRAQLGIAQDDDVAIQADCRVNDATCRRDNECCSNKCQVKGRKRKRRGKCECAGQNAKCQADRGCCSGLCRKGKCDCGNKGDLCGNDSDCCSRRCEDGACRCGKRNDRCADNRGCCSDRCGSDGFCL